MNYVAYELETGNIRFFYTSSGPIYEAPVGLYLLNIDSSFTSECINTHKVINQQMVLIE